MHHCFCCMRTVSTCCSNRVLMFVAFGRISKLLWNVCFLFILVCILKAPFFFSLFIYLFVHWLIWFDRLFIWLVKTFGNFVWLFTMQKQFQSKSKIIIHFVSSVWFIVSVISSDVHWMHLNILLWWWWWWWNIFRIKKNNHFITSFLYGLHNEMWPLCLNVCIKCKMVRYSVRVSFIVS